MNRGPDLRRATPLARILAEEITRRGPLKLSAYMERCLLDETYGYYRTRSALGRDGDFITAPEISQVFGELIGLWAAVTWQQMGAPVRVRAIELGAGRGTLLVDMLRAARAVPAFRQALSIEIVEINPVLRQKQREALQGCGVPISWHHALDDVSIGLPAIVVANEFLDTLPIDQWRCHHDILEQAFVTTNAAGMLEFAWCTPDGCCDPTDIRETMPDGADVYETRDAAPLVSTLARWAARAPLAALFIDYGQNAPATQDTLQALRAHTYEHPLASPGEADLTSQVDFAALARTCTDHGLAVDGPVPQASFLGSLGVVERASRLMAANPTQRSTIETGIARLLSPTGMGSRFLALGVRSPSLAPLAGLDMGASAVRR